MTVTGVLDREFFSFGSYDDQESSDSGDYSQHNCLVDYDRRAATWWDLR